MQKVFCSVCQDAEKNMMLSTETKRKETYTSTGFSDWPNAKARFVRREETQSHRTAGSLLKHETPGAVPMITEAKRKEMADARVALHMIFDAAQHIAGQGNAFR